MVYTWLYVLVGVTDCIPTLICILKCLTHITTMILFGFLSNISFALQMYYLNDNNIYDHFMR